MRSALWLMGLAACEPSVADAERRMLGYGERFGECVGFCDSQVRFSGVEVTYTAVSPDASLDNRGVLTDDGRRVLQDLVLDGSVVLELVYGCPDCADGGEGTMQIGTPDGGLSEHRFEVGDPPDLLIGMAEFGQEMLEALASCTSTTRIEIDGFCEVLPTE